MATVHYFWDEIEDAVVQEYDEHNNTLAHYTTEPRPFGPVLSQQRSGEVRHFHFDGQGNTCELTDDSGDVTDMFRYTAFGETIQSSGTTMLRYRYNGLCGYASEPCALYYVRFRHLGSSFGRWMSLEPSHSILDHYVYVANRATALVDPDGMTPRPTTIFGTTPRGGSTSSDLDIIMKTVQGPTSTNCGGFSWTVHWKLQKAPAGSGAYIVQRIRIYCAAFRCGHDKPITTGCPKDKNGNGQDLVEFWEAWPVKPDMTESTIAGSHDTYADASYGDCTCGESYTLGDYWLIVGKLPDEFQPYGVEAAREVPATWKDMSEVTYGKPRRHDIHTMWNCCNDKSECPRKSSLVSPRVLDEQP